MIRFRGVTKRFGRLDVLRGIDVQFGEGRVTGIVGPNGSGKTTLLRTLLGLTRQSGGTIEIDGVAIGRDERYRVRIGYMPQIARFPENLTGNELLALLRDLRQTDTAPDRELIDRFQLAEAMTRPLRTLSGGTRQKVNAAIAFAFCPDLLVLDEPTAGLDPLASAILKDTVLAGRAVGRTVIVTSHVLSEIDELCDDIVVLLDGRACFAGPVHDLKLLTKQLNLERAVATLMIREAAA